MDHALLQRPTSRCAHKPTYAAAEENWDRVPPSIRRKGSKGGLRAIFIRHKIEKPQVPPVLEEPTVIVTKHNPDSRSQPKSTGNLPEDDDSRPVTLPMTKVKPSRLDFGAISARKHGSLLKKPNQNTFATPITSASRTPTRACPSFDPLPYFQALPQAIRHAQLSASTMSADAILRLSKYQYPNSHRDTTSHSTPESKTEELSLTTRSSEKTRTTHRRHASGSISKAEWTQKIFVLTTSGTMLQYTVDGSFDRLPEKMLQLGKESVAFACDAIPGKHWVLQISQRIEPDGTPAPDSRSMLSRLSFRKADCRRSATSFLLVLDSAKEMDSWIALVRREIEALGGRTATSETGKPKIDNKVIQLSAQPSHRYLVKRDSAQTLRQSPQPSPTCYGPPSPLSVTARFEDGLRNTESILSRPLSSALASTGYQSVSNSTTSFDGQQLDSLRDGSNRLSYVSSGQMSLLTSEESTPTGSPTRDNIRTMDDVSAKSLAVDSAQWKYDDRRQSLQPSRILGPEMQPLQHILRPHSIYGAPSRPLRNLSPATPNFSVPIFSSKRFSTTKSIGLCPPPSQGLLAHPAAPYVTSVTERRKSKKPPPLSLNLTRTPISPITPSRAPVVFTPTESSFKIVPHVKASVIDIARSPLSARSPMQSGENIYSPPRRVSSLLHLEDLEQAYTRSPTYDQLTSEAVRHEFVNLTDPPVRPAPLPPALTALAPIELQVSHHSERIESVLAFKDDSLTALREEQRVFQRPMSLDVEQSLVRKSSHSNEPIRPRSSKSEPPPAPGCPQCRTTQELPVSQAKPFPRQVVASSLSSSRPSSQHFGLPDHRLSIPSFSGPPLAPPPECALPPLPRKPGAKSKVGPSTGALM